MPPAVAAFLLNPRVIGTALIVLGLGVGIAHHKFTVDWPAEKQIANAERNEAKAQARLAEVARDLATSEGNVRTLRSAVRTQNDRIVGLEASARAIESAANARATARLLRGERDRLALRLDTHFGPAAMNDWFRAMFGNRRP